MLSNDEIIRIVVAKHFKKLESKLLEIKLPQLAYIAISKEFRWLESDLKKGIAEGLPYFEDKKDSDSEV